MYNGCLNGGFKDLSLYSGISSQKMAISEIGVSFPDESFGKESRFGIPFTVSYDC